MLVWHVVLVENAPSVFTEGWGTPIKPNFMKEVSYSYQSHPQSQSQDE